MAGGRASRPRQERAVSNEGVEEASDLLQKFRIALPGIGDQIIKDAKTDPEARKQILNMMSGEVTQARSGRASEIFVRLAALREAGSPILQKLWGETLKPAMDAYETQSSLQ